jgi:hypothetical protein
MWSLPWAAGMPVRSFRASGTRTGSSRTPPANPSRSSAASATRSTPAPSSSSPNLSQHPARPRDYGRGEPNLWPHLLRSGSPSHDPNTKPSERRLGPGVTGIGAASFLADVGHEIPTAVLPNLLTATLGAPDYAYVLEPARLRVLTNRPGSWQPVADRPGATIRAWTASTRTPNSCTAADSTGPPTRSPDRPPYQPLPDGVWGRRRPPAGTPEPDPAQRTDPAPSSPAWRCARAMICSTTSVLASAYCGTNRQSRCASSRLTRW